jgi:23S rRNA (pseudouridine1915-N3)-methyltransferase
LKLVVVAVGQRQPGWADAACDDFARRFPPDLKLEVKALKAEARNGRTAEQCKAAEGERIEAALGRGLRRVVLDERGTRTTTKELAARLEAWKLDGRDVALVIGGPDGLSDGVKQTADETLRLSDLTLPHALARVLLIEALYRAWSVTVNHPYHRE